MQSRVLRAFCTELVSNVYVEGSFAKSLIVAALRGSKLARDVGSQHHGSVYDHEWGGIVFGRSRCIERFLFDVVRNWGDVQ